MLACPGFTVAYGGMSGLYEDKVSGCTVCKNECDLRLTANDCGDPTSEEIGST